MVVSPRRLTRGSFRVEIDLNILMSIIIISLNLLVRIFILYGWLRVQKIMVLFLVFIDNNRLSCTPISTLWLDIKLWQPLVCLLNTVILVSLILSHALLHDLFYNLFHLFIVFTILVSFCFLFRQLDGFLQFVFFLRILE